MRLWKRKKRTYKINSLEEVIYQNENKRDTWTFIGVTILIMVVMLGLMFCILELKRLSGG